MVPMWRIFTISRRRRRVVVGRTLRLDAVACLSHGQTALVAEQLSLQTVVFRLQDADFFPESSKTRREKDEFLFNSKLKIFYVGMDCMHNFRYKKTKSRQLDSAWLRHEEQHQCDHYNKYAGHVFVDVVNIFVNFSGKTKENRRHNGKQTVSRRMINQKRCNVLER